MSTAAIITFTPCCGQGSPVSFQSQTVPAAGSLPGVYNSGVTVLDAFKNAIVTEGECYVLTSTTVTLAELGNYPVWPGGPLTYVTSGDICPVDEPLCPCGGEENPVYKVYYLTSCCGGKAAPVYVINNTLPTGLVLYTGELLNPDLKQGCYTITEASYTSKGVPPYTLVYSADFTAQGPGIDCTSDECKSYCPKCTCIRVRWVGPQDPGTATFRYWDCEQTFVDLAVPKDGTFSDKFCHTIIGVTLEPNWEVEYFGDCSLNQETTLYECPSCYRLDDCEGVANPIYSLDQSLSQYVGTSQSINIAGSEVCWTVTKTTETCDCAITTTVTAVYYNCEACKNKKGYKLTECTTQEIIYTTDDLSQYDSVYITMDCPGCWYVESINMIPPTVQPVTVTNGFETCELCKATYYELTDCTGLKESIITTTDLSDYVGKVIKIKFCDDTCWEVNVTTPQSLSGDVILTEEFIDCQTCYTTSLPTTCVTFTNTADYPVGFGYIDYLGNVNKTTLQAKGSIPKVCVISWDVNQNITVTQFGSCIDGVCPVTPQPKRLVTPGYNTPICSTDYYEKVECSFSELMYKDVLQKRYGISNCCPEELTKWEIKHEMLMLDILVNPDYECTPITTCQCPVIGGVTTNTSCPDISHYIIEKCSEPAISEVVRIENQYDVLGNVILIDNICYNVIQKTNRLVTVYWTPSVIYTTCVECEDAQV